MNVIDCHHHLWNTKIVHIPWLMGSQASFGDPAAIRAPYGPSEYRRDAGSLNVVASVFVCTECLPTQAVDEAIWVTGVADASGTPAGMIAFADVESPDLKTALDSLGRSPLLRGVRLRVNYDEASGRRIARSADVMDGEPFRRGLRELASRELLFELSVFAPQLPAAARMARAVPECILVLNHVGWPLATDAASFAQWRAGMAELAANKNVMVKVSGFWSIDRQWAPDKIEPWVKETYALFGPERCMYGSNLPIEKLMCPMPRQVEILSTILAREPAAALEQLFVKTAARVFRLEPRQA